MVVVVVVVVVKREGENRHQERGQPSVFSKNNIMDTKTKTGSIRLHFVKNGKIKKMQRDLLLSAKNHN